MTEYSYESDEQRALRASDLRKRAAFFSEKLSSEGIRLSPVIATRKAIASTFWGREWNRNLSRYSVFADQMPAGRTMLRNHCLIDLRSAAGSIQGLIATESLYETVIRAKTISPQRWALLVESCSVSIVGLSDLLAGRLSDEVMASVTNVGTGLFPDCDEISFSCSCPDWNEMCAHIAATLYGFSMRLDEKPELLFELRGVSAKELTAATADRFSTEISAASSDVAEDLEQLEDLFGIDIKR